jgi:hypothetical protein
MWKSIVRKANRKVGEAVSSELRNERALPEVVVHTFGRDPRDFGNPDSGPSVVLRERGLEIELVFESRRGDSPLLELRVLPDKAKQLEPEKVREVVPPIGLYLAAARAALEWNFAEARDLTEALRQIGRPGRGHSDDFFRSLAIEYEVLVKRGEKHPVKTIAGHHSVGISAASRWLKEVRRRGYLPEKEAKSDA